VTLDLDVLAGAGVDHRARDEVQHRKLRLAQPRGALVEHVAAQRGLAETGSLLRLRRGGLLREGRSDECEREADRQRGRQSEACEARHGAGSPS
jgi:hypothetical protein